MMIDIDNFFNNDDIMTSLLKKLKKISIKIGVIKRYVVAIVFTPPTPTRQSSFVTSASDVYRALFAASDSFS